MYETQITAFFYCNVYHFVLLYRYWWNTGIFPFTKKNSYLHRAQWRYYFYLSHVRILVSPWLLLWLANYKRASRSGARPVLLKFHSQNAFEVRRRYSYWWLSRLAAKFSHRYFFPSLKNIQEDLPRSRKVMWKNSLRGKKMQTLKKDLQRLRIS